MILIDFPFPKHINTLLGQFILLFLLFLLPIRQWFLSIGSQYQWRDHLLRKIRRIRYQWRDLLFLLWKSNWWSRSLILYLLQQILFQVRSWVRGTCEWSIDNGWILCFSETSLGVLSRSSLSALPSRYIEFSESIMKILLFHYNWTHTLWNSFWRRWKIYVGISNKRSN